MFNCKKTAEPNIILELISRPVAGSEEDKKRKVGEFSDLSTNVPRTGILSFWIPIFYKL
jgi:hypothetical protein